MLKEKIRESESALSQRQCKWRNIMFDKSARKYTGKMLYDTKEQAAQRIRELEADLKIRPIDIMSLEGPDLEYGEYAWAMQMPILMD